MENEHHPQNISVGLLLFNALLFMLIVVMVFLIYGMLHQPKIDTAPGQVVLKTTAFNNLNLEAKAVYVFDVAENKVIFSKNETAQLPLASLTKLMMALTASDLLPGNSHITIRKEFLSPEGDSGLLPNESWKMKDLLDFSLVVSSNDGARSLASVIGAFDLKTEDYDLGLKDFITKMNVWAQDLHLTQTYFINESGLDEGNVSGGYSSARDVSALVQYILIHKPEILEATKFTTTTIDSFSKKHIAVNTNTDVGQIPGLLASKTGYTDLAGGNLVVAFDASIERPIIAVVLGSSEKGRFVDVDALVKASMEYVRQ